MIWEFIYIVIWWRYILGENIFFFSSSYNYRTVKCRVTAITPFKSVPRLYSSTKSSKIMPAWGNMPLLWAICTTHGIGYSKHYIANFLMHIFLSTPTVTLFSTCKMSWKE